MKNTDEEFNEIQRYCVLLSQLISVPPQSSKMEISATIVND